MQYTLSQVAATAILVLEPVDFRTLQTTYIEKNEPLPNLHVEQYAFCEKHALQEADEEVAKQAAGGRPTDPTRPWSGQPYSHRTRSQASFARQQARQEHYRQSKRQQEYCQVIVSSAVCEALAHDSVPAPLKPYAENQYPCHPFTGTGCTGLTEDTDSVSEDHRECPSVEFPETACDLATPDTYDCSIMIKSALARGRLIIARQKAQALTVGVRTISSLPSIPSMTSNDDAFQDAEEDTL